jgi:anti-anti-sigma regulatory factor
MMTKRWTRASDAAEDPPPRLPAHAPEAAPKLSVVGDVATLDLPARTIELPPDLIVHEPEPLRLELLAALAGGGPISIDASAVHRVGIVALQLLLAFLREARQKGVLVEICGVRPELDEALACTGLAEQPELVSARH